MTLDQGQWMTLTFDIHIDSCTHLVNRIYSTAWEFFFSGTNCFTHCKKVNRKDQGMPQSQTAANPRHQEEEKKDKNIHARNKQMYEKHKDQFPLPQERW